MAALYWHGIHKVRDAASCTPAAENRTENEPEVTCPGQKSALGLSARGSPDFGGAQIQKPRRTSRTDKPH